MRTLFLLFIVMPVLEMWLLIEVGSHIGALNTIALVLLTAMVGMALLRQQGLSTLMQVNQRLNQGQLPAEQILGGVLLAVGGALLLTPGFVTDGIGFACLLPMSRKLIVAALLKRGLLQAQSHAGFGSAQQGDFQARSRPESGAQGSNTIEGEFRREE